MRWFAGGVFVGLLMAGYLLPARQESAPSPSGPAARPSPPAPGPRAPQPPLAVLAFQQAQADELAAEAFGVPLEWPSDRTRESAIEAVRAAMDQCPEEYRALEMDCSEPPCLVAVRLGGSKVSALREACDGWLPFTSVEVGRPCGDEVAVATYAVTPAAAYEWHQPAEVLGRNAETRARVRRESLRSGIHCRDLR